MPPGISSHGVNPFTPRANLITRAVIVSALLFLGMLACFAYAYTRSAYATRVGIDIPQPVPFSHAHHVTGLGIDCRYCHATAEVTAFAGMPSTDTCMNCHWQIWTEADMLAKVRDSWRTGTPIAWRRVHDVADFAYFDHSIHVNKGVGCSSCHGRVDLMPLVHKSETLLMQWCLDCHRQPAPHLRPRTEIYNMLWDPLSLSRQDRQQLMNEYRIEEPRSLTDCSTCHR